MLKPGGKRAAQVRPGLCSSNQELSTRNNGTPANSVRIRYTKAGSVEDVLATHHSVYPGPADSNLSK
jgi:hypothetical protein